MRESGLPARLRNRGLVVPAIGLAASAFLGAGIGGAPKIALLEITALSFLVLVLSPMARLTWVVIGGMFVLGGPLTLAVFKVIYVAGCAVAASAALMRVRSLRETPAYAEVVTLLRVSSVFAVFVFAEMVLAIIAGTPRADAFRGSAPYLLFACVPMFALDARTSTRADLIKSLFVMVGLAATASLVVEWVTRRGLGDWANYDIVLAGSLPAAMFNYLSAGFLVGRQRLLWAVGAGCLFALIMLSGNRGSFSMLLGPLAIAVILRGRWRRFLEIVLAGPILAFLAFAVSSFLAGALGLDYGALARRYEGLLHPSQLASDMSIETRLAQTRAAWQVLLSKPIQGAGPGHVFVWTTTWHGQGSSARLDSPLQFPAQFGILGVVLLLVVVIAYGRLLLRLIRALDVYRAAALGFGVSQLATLLWQHPPIENVGFTLGFLLLIILSLPGRTPPEEADRAFADRMESRW